MKATNVYYNRGLIIIIVIVVRKTKSIKVTRVMELERGPLSFIIIII